MDTSSSKLEFQESRNVFGSEGMERKADSNVNESTNPLQANSEDMGNPNAVIEDPHPQPEELHAHTNALPSCHGQTIMDSHDNCAKPNQSEIENENSSSQKVLQPIYSPVKMDSEDNYNFVRETETLSECLKTPLCQNQKSDDRDNMVTPQNMLSSKCNISDECMSGTFSGDICIQAMNSDVAVAPTNCDITPPQCNSNSLNSNEDAEAPYLDTEGGMEIGAGDPSLDSQVDTPVVSELSLMKKMMDCTRTTNTFVVAVSMNEGDQISSSCNSSSAIINNVPVGDSSQLCVDNVQFVHKDCPEIMEGADKHSTTEELGILSPKTPVLDTSIAEDISVMDSGNNDIVLMSDINFTGRHQNDNMNSHRGAVVPYSDTDDSDSSSSSSSSDSSSSEESSVSESVGSDSENEVVECHFQRKTMSSIPKPPKVKGELDVVDLPLIEDLHISVRNDQVAEIGKVLHIVDTLVVVECYEDQPPLDIDSVLFLDCGARPLGRVFDVMGPVTEPLYCVRFNSKLQIEERNICPGMLVYCAPHTEHSNFVFVQKLVAMKGSDASWKKDKEVPISELDFSDDDEESKIRKKGESHNKVAGAKCADEPRSKVSKTARQQIPGSFQSDASRFQGSARGGIRGDYRPRNPWGWPGAQNSFSRNTQQQQNSNYQNQSCSQSPVMPSLLNVDLHGQYQTTASTSISGQGNLNYSSDSQFGRKSDPMQFSQFPPTAGNNYNPSWTSNRRPVPNQRTYDSQNSFNNYNTSWDSNDRHASSRRSFNPNNNSNFCQRLTSNEAPPSSQENYIPHNMTSQSRYPSEMYHQEPNQEHQRYLAFQSEISKLVEAYNSGAGSPAAVPPPALGMHQPLSFGMRPPPLFGTRPPPSFGARTLQPPSHRHRFNNP